MHKVVILIEEPADRAAFDELWPHFLRSAEAMPGLIRESSCHVDYFLYGDQAYVQMHELFFDTAEGARQALTSPQGQTAGGLLQRMTGGRMTLFLADHKEESGENIRLYQQARNES